MKFLPVGADIWVGEHLCFFRTFTGTQGQTAQAKVLRFGGTRAPGGGSLLLGCCAVITSLYIKKQRSVNLHIGIMLNEIHIHCSDDQSLLKYVHLN